MEPMYWKTNKSWYRINYEKDCFELTDEAPERARKSFEMYLELQRSHRKIDISTKPDTLSEGSQRKARRNRMDRMAYQKALKEREEILANEPIKCIPLTEEELEELRKEGRI